MREIVREKILKLHPNKEERMGQSIFRAPWPSHGLRMSTTELYGDFFYQMA